MSCTTKIDLEKLRESAELFKSKDLQMGVNPEALLELLDHIAKLEASETKLITERDHCEEVIDRMADAVLGPDRHEWTSAYDIDDAAEEVEQRAAQLEKENVAKQRDAGRWKPKKWAEEEQANGNTGIRWVNEEGVHGRPTDHDVREYLIRTETARGCHCDSCQAFYKFDTAMESNHG